MEPRLWTYLIAITLLTLTPGVDTMLIIRNTSRGGWRDGAVSSVGICTGLFVHATVSAVGISVILLQSAIAFSALKLVGAGYLVWLGAGQPAERVETAGKLQRRRNSRMPLDFGSAPDDPSWKGFSPTS